MTEPVSATDPPGGLVISDLAVAAGGRTLLQSVTRTVGRGRALHVAGPPASGKSTVLAVCAGELHQSAGSVQFDGHPVHSAAVRQQLGYAPQYSRILDTLTAVENVALPLLAEGVPVTDAWTQASAALDRLGLAESSWHNLAEQLSGGQRQRVALARVTVTRPALLVIDDPTSELDSETAHHVHALFVELMNATTTVVLATTDPALAELAEQRIQLS